MKRFLLFIYIFFVTYINFSNAKDHISVFYKVINNRQITFYASNTNYCPYQILVNIEILDNMSCSNELPFYGIIEPQSENVYLFSLITKFNITNNFKLNYSFTYFLGDPEMEDNLYEDNYEYLLPFQDGEGYKLTQGYNGKYSHTGWTKYSLDFGLYIGTPICAARDGVVVDIKIDSNISGRSSKYKKYANYITIYHSNGTFSQYLHIKKDGSNLKIGDVVKKGDIIAYSGNTGWTRGPHLHFMVFKPVFMGYETIPTSFITKEGILVELEPKKIYYSYHNHKYNESKTTEIVENNNSENTETNLGGF